MSPALFQSVQPRIVALVMLAALGLTLLGSYLYLLKGPMADFSRLREQRATSVEELNKENRDLDGAAIVRLERQIETLKDRLYGKGGSLSPSDMVPYVIGQLDRIARHQGVQLESVKPGEMQTVLMFEEVPFDVQVQGAYRPIYAWLQEVERELRPMVVKQFRITPASNSGRLQMTLRIVSYRFSEQRP
jgi:type IV pilus assembly protein PilO